MDIRKIGRECVDWIDLDEDSDKWRNLVHAVNNKLVPKNGDNMLTSSIDLVISKRPEDDGHKMLKHVAHNSQNCLVYRTMKFH